MVKKQKLTEEQEQMVEEVFEKKPTPEEIEKSRMELIEVYNLIIKTLKYYCDLEEKYYSLISLWIIGTYMHNEFPSYPYLFFNAMKGSGKTRILRLITYLSKEGCMLNSLTEAVLFREKGTLGIDEFEGINRQGNENLKELLNSAYKKGIDVKRMRKVKNIDGENQEIQKFNVYRPILMANIQGMDEILNDRCITIILDKSNKTSITKKMELFESDINIQKIKGCLNNDTNFPLKSVVSVDVVSLQNTYEGWNQYTDILENNNIHNNILNIRDTNSTNDILSFYDKLDKTGIEGRNLELAMALLILARFLDNNIFETLLKTLKEIIVEKKKEDSIESPDISLIDFISQQVEDGKFKFQKDLFQNFRMFVGIDEEWLNEKWFGRALKRLNLVKEKKRVGSGRLVMLDIQKAQEKIRMFQ